MTLHPVEHPASDTGPPRSFGTLWPVTSLRLNGPMAFEAEPGDLVFGNRLSWVQVAKNVSADQLTHCAVVVDLGGVRSVVEVGPRGCVTRSLAAFCQAYRYVAFARPAATTDCRESMLGWATSQVGAPVHYAWSHFGVAGIASMARRFLPDRAEPLVVRTSRHLARRVDHRSPPMSMVCSSFVWDCLHRLCPRCRPHLEWPLRGRVSPLRARPSVTDVFASARRNRLGDRSARILANPSDLWVAPGYRFKVVANAAGTTLLHRFDETTPITRIPAARLRRGSCRQHRREVHP